MNYDRTGSNSRYVDYTLPRDSNSRTNGTGYNASVSSYEYSQSDKRPLKNAPRANGGIENSKPRYESKQVYSNRNYEYDPTDPLPSDFPESEIYTVKNETLPRHSWEVELDEPRAASRTASEIYAATRFQQRPRSEYSQYSYRSNPAKSDMVNVKTKTTMDGKLVMETMTAPHPCCPNTKSVCCLMILLNLSLLLLCLGFIVVLQLPEPPYVWYIGIAMLVVGFLVLFGSLIYCIVVCKETEHLRAPPGELYWTNRWAKQVNLPELHYSNTQFKPSDYKGSEFSYKTEPSRTTGAGTQSQSYSRY